MFVLTLHRDSWKKGLVLIGCAVVLCGVILGISGLVGTARAALAVANGNVVKNTGDMANFLLGYGIEVDVGTAQVLQVTIPKKFDASFKAFNKVLEECGMSLEKYKGKMVEKWVLQSPNRTVEAQTAYAVLLVKSDKVIGGYLLYQPSGEVISLASTLDVKTLSPQAEETVGTDDKPREEQTAAPEPDSAEPTADPQEPPAAETVAEAEGEEEDVYPID